MQIGIPKEVKVQEGRVALIPAAAAEMVGHGHDVFVQSGAGLASGYNDADYEAVGVNVLKDAASLYSAATLIVKVKEPYGSDLEYLNRGHTVFSYLHLAANIELMTTLRDIGLTAIAFETVEDDQGMLPLLAPMSDIAGRIAVQTGMLLLHQPQGGKGILLGGLPAVERGNVVILGAGVAGGNAASVAAALGANVTVFDRSRAKLAQMRALGSNVTALYSFSDSIRQSVMQADLVIGAVLVTGARAPVLVDTETVKTMQAGSVIIDISVDQGGCIETTRPTSYETPTFNWEGIVHYGVTNMPGAVPRSASQALSAALVPYVLKLANFGCDSTAELAAGINVRAGDIIHPALKALSGI